MINDTLNSVVVNSNNSYELVMNLKSLKNAGYRSIRTKNGSKNIGRLMFEIVSMSKAKYTYDEILDELRNY